DGGAGVVGAEETEGGRALGELRVGPVFRPGWQPAAGEQDVEAGEEGQPNGQGQRRGPGRVLRVVPVDDVSSGEERGAADEQVPLDLHATPPSWRAIAGARLPRRPGPLIAAPKRICVRAARI